MEDGFLIILVVAVVAFIAWGLMQTRFEFEIRVDHGHAFVHKGKVTPAFVEFVTAVCRDTGVDRGWVGGVRRANRIALRFSGSFPPGSRQRMRNEWQFVG